jgi:hypothetical protein
VLLGLSRRKKPFRWGVRIGIASLVPFGTFFLDRELREDDERWRAERASSRARA